MLVIIQPAPEFQSCPILNLVIVCLFVYISGQSAFGNKMITIKDESSLAQFVSLSKLAKRAGK